MQVGGFVRGISQSGRCVLGNECFGSSALGYRDVLLTESAASFLSGSVFNPP